VSERVRVDVVGAVRTITLVNPAARAAALTGAEGASFGRSPPAFEGR